MSIYGVGNVVTTGYGKMDGIKAEVKSGESEATKSGGRVEQKAQNYQKNNAAAIESVKAEVDRRTESLRSLVEKMISQQGQTLGRADGMWSFIAGGNYNVDAKTKTEAQQAISADGYWGVEQTSQRIVDFAKNLTGGDAKKMEEMRTAIDKGFRAATKSWGQKLPDISSQTYDSIMKKLDDWEKESTGNVAG